MVCVIPFICQNRVGHAAVCTHFIGLLPVEFVGWVKLLLNAYFQYSPWHSVVFVENCMQPLQISIRKHHIFFSLTSHWPEQLLGSFLTSKVQGPREETRTPVKFPNHCNISLLEAWHQSIIPFTSYSYSYPDLLPKCFLIFPFYLLILWKFLCLC